jgi:hypothetical protein
MAKKSIKTISDKLAKINDNFTIHMYDNGYMIAFSGQDSDEEWANANIVCNTVEELTALVLEATNMERA